jgi:hypothetical protein
VLRYVLAITEDHRMTAKIIHLSRYNLGLVHPATGVRFPQLYRVRGFYWDDAGLDNPIDPESSVPSTVEAPISYTLSTEETLGLANVTFEPMRGMNLPSESGRILIRHHASLVVALGYVDALVDSGKHNQLRSYIYETPGGVFTLLHRESRPEEKASCVLYIVKSVEEDSSGVQWVWDKHLIVEPDGTSVIVEVG